MSINSKAAAMTTNSFTSARRSSAFLGAGGSFIDARGPLRLTARELAPHAVERMMPLGAHLRLHDVGDQRPASAAACSGAASFADSVWVLGPSTDLFSDDAVADAVAVADNHGVFRERVVALLMILTI